METTNNNRALYLEDFIPVLVTAWQAAGHDFGVDNHFQLRKLLQQFSSDHDFGELKYLLAPIFADNPKEQDEFYDLFDVVFRDTKAALIQHEERVVWIDNKTIAEQWQALKQNSLQQWDAFTKLQRRTLFSASCTLLLALVSWGIYSHYFSPVDKEISKQPSQLLNLLKDGESNQFCIYNDAPGIGHPTTISLLSSPSPIVNVVSEIEGENICLQTQSQQAGRTEVAYQICYSSGQCRPFTLICLVGDNSYLESNHKLLGKGNWVIKKSEVAKASPSETGETERGMPNSLIKRNTVLDTMMMSADPIMAIEGVTSSTRFGKGFSYFSRTKAAALGIIACLFLLIGWLIRRKRQKFAMEHQANKEQPHVWNIRIPSLKKVDLGETFNKNLRNMLRRDKMASQRLDVKKTIKTSMAKGGAIDLQYLQFKQGRQYLILLDTSSQNNHRSKILNLFIESLKKEGAPVKYYFFDRDPRQCWNDDEPKGISLKQLAHSYQNSHLICCSDNHFLLEPTTGEFASWTNVFDAWRKKLILTPRDYHHWDHQEIMLSKMFSLLPCTPKGISFLVDSLESVESLDYKKLGYIETDERLYNSIQIPAQLKGAQLIAYLEAEFANSQYDKTNEVLLKWIAACAMPPVLFWHWTLYVGQLLSTEIHNHLSLENLFQLIRLPWFIDGKMPEDVRLTLINWLEEKHPGWLSTLRREWDSILNLEENLPPPNSIAWEGHRLEIVLNELLMNPSWTEKRKLELELEQLMYGKEEQDAMLIKYLDKKNNALEAVLSNRFRRFIQEKDSFFWRFRMWVWQLPVLLILFISSLLMNPTEPVVTFQFKNRITGLAFSNDNQSFLVASGLGGLSVCTVEGEWVQGLEESKSSLMGLSYNHNGTKILAGSSDNLISSWDVSGVPLFMRQGPKMFVKDVAFHPLKPNIVLIGYFEKKAELWDIKRNERLLVVHHKDEVNSVAFSPTGELFLTGSSDNTARLWNVKGELLQIFDQHKGKVHSVAFSPDGLYIATGSRDNAARIWDLKGKLIHTLDDGHTYDVFDVSFSPDGSQLVTASGDDKAILWSVEKGQKLRDFRGHRNYITNAAFSPNGNYLLTGDREGKVKLWTLKTVDEN